MQNNIRNTNLRFNLDKEQQRRAWEYLQTMDRQDFKSYSQVISLALVDYFDRYYRTQADPYHKRSRSTTIGRLIGYPLMAPMVDFQNSIFHAHPLHTLF